MRRAAALTALARSRPGSSIAQVQKPRGNVKPRKPDPARTYSTRRQAVEDGFIVDHLLWGWVYEYRKWLGRYPEALEIRYPDGHLLGGL
jgi:hypothetical protein